jgi:PAS domain S-box-containing protein
MDELKNSITKTEMLDALMENIPDAIYFKDIKSRFIRVNKALIKRLGINSFDEISGKSDFDFFTEVHAKKAYKDEQEIIKTGKPLINIEEKETFEGGENKWVSTTKMPLFNKNGQIRGTFGISRDITAIKKAEENLKHLNNVLRAIRNINQLIVREKNTKKLISKACENLTENRGYYNAWVILMDKTGEVNEYAHSMVGNIFDGLVKSIKNKNIVKCINESLSGNDVILISEPSSACRGCPISGNYAQRSAMAARLEYGSKVYGVICASVTKEYANSRYEIELFKEIADDIAFALHNLEQEKKRKDTAERLKIAKIEAEKSAVKAMEADRAKSEFLANMSHEIRTPLNAILGFSEILKEQLEDPKYSKFTDTIITSGKTLLGLINDILDLSKIEAGKIDFQHRPVDPQALFNDIARIFEIKVKDKGLKFLTDIDEKLPASLLLDEVRVRQILFNLVGNAVKFTDEGYVKLKVKGVFYPDRSKIDLIFSVKDTGIGISEEDKRIIFNVFKQSSGQSMKKYGGTGLGLAITKRLVEMMNGAISVESAIGKGSVFKIKMKEISVASLDPDFELKRSQAEDILFCGQKVLVVDDIESNRMLLNEILSVYGLKVIEAVNGKEALNMAANKKPDIILMDLRMPVMDGYEAIRILKASKNLNKIPVIVLTASAMRSTEEDIKKIKCDGYIRKPVSRYELISELKKYLEFNDKNVNIPEEKVLSDKRPVIIKQYESSAATTSKIIEKLENDFLKRIEKIKKEFVINDIEDFAKELQEFGELHGLEEIRCWSSRLSEQAANFDLGNLQGTLGQFNEILNKIKNSGKG